MSQPNQPDDLEQELHNLARQGTQRLKQVLGGGSSGVPIALGLVVLLIGVWTSVYTVPSDSVAVVQRFGRYTETVPAGLHLRLPLGIDRSTVVPIKRQLKQEFGFTTPGATDPFQSRGTRAGRQKRRW